MTEEQRLKKKERQKKYYQKNKEVFAQKQREYIEKNKEEIKIKRKIRWRKWADENKDYDAERQKKYYYENKELLSKKNKEYRENNKERLKEYEKIRYKNNIEKNRERTKKWRKKNLEHCRNYSLQYNRKRLDNDRIFRLRNNINTLFRITMKLYSKNGKTKSMNKYGIDIKAIVEKLGNPPQDGKKYHIDHIFPVSAFDLNNPEHIKLCWHPDNLRWLEASENLSKNAKYDEVLFEEYLKKVS